MKFAFALLLIAASCQAQNAAIEHGAQLIPCQLRDPVLSWSRWERRGRAPRLIGHHFQCEAQMFKNYYLGHSRHRDA